MSTTPNRSANQNRSTNQPTVFTSTSELIQWNKEVSMTISVDSIANKFLEILPTDYKHRELLTNAVIGTALDTQNLGYIFNALNGYVEDIDFKIGETIECTEKERRVNTFSEEGLFLSSEDVEICSCQVVEINPYSNRKIKVQFMQHKFRSEEYSTETLWVDHRTCTKVGVTDLVPVP